MTPVHPKRIGILGGGQLARMIILAGYPLGLRFRILDPNPESPAATLCEHIVADFTDRDALDLFLTDLDLVTYEFENVPISAVELIASRINVAPNAMALKIAQDRLNEKSLFIQLGIPTVPFRQIDSLAQLEKGVQELGLPAVLKTRRMGYDGKGQYVLRSKADSRTAWELLGAQALILEGWADFDTEFSVIAARGSDGELAIYPLVENQHREGILRRSVPYPLASDSPIAIQARSAVRAILEHLNYVGVVALELFRCGNALLANEIAPRVHNSGHWTIEGAQTSQFENHLRAICGIPLGNTDLVQHVGMLNLIGSHPPAAQLAALPGAHLHLYDKEFRPNRKVGHLTIRAESAVLRDQVLAQAVEMIA